MPNFMKVWADSMNKLKIKYRGSLDSKDSISTVLGIVRFPISTKLPKFLAIVQFFRDFCGKSGL